MSKTLAELAALVDGVLTGEPDRVITGAAPFDAAGSNDITFAGAPDYLSRAAQCPAGAILVPSGWAGDAPSVIRVVNPQLAFVRIVAELHPPSRPAGGVHPAAVVGENTGWGDSVSIGPQAVIGRDVTLGHRVAIGPGVVIGDGVTIGNDVTLQANVVIGDGCRLGNRVTIHPGTVIGSDGFGYVPDGSAYVKIPHRGAVRIDDDVEIGANVTIDRATFGDTRICRGVKIDNLVHVAHHCVIGEDTLLVAQVGISGSVTIGRHAILAGQVGIAGHITIGDNVMIGAQSGIGHSVDDGKMVSGSPGIAHRQWLRAQRVWSQLPELKKTVDRLKRRIEALDADHSEPTDQ